MGFLDKIPLPPKTTFNVGLTPAGNATMLGLFGHPVQNAAYLPSGDCTPANNATFVKLLETRTVGPFTVTGLKPALDSMAQILGRVKTEVPDLYNALGTAGMHCARFRKITKNGVLKIGPNISNHSWGTAVDIKLAGQLDKQGDGITLRGLLVLSAFFNAASWYWGAGFSTEDAMHFEVSKSLLAKWKQAGAI